MLASPATPVELFPRSFGRYHLLSPLAQGGMGSLYLACVGDPGFEKLCVVKTVLPQLADKDYIARFRDEAKLVVKLSHGNLVQVFDAGMAHGELYIAMDFVDGKDLRAVWNRCARRGIAFPVDIAVHIVRELARGLAHAHTCGIELVHRDVSPPNVLLAYSGEVKLTDFGLASSTLKVEKTAPGVIYGKVSYMSPEQARGEPLDGRADQYAAGIILWELLTGRQLFPTSDTDVLERVRLPSIDSPAQRTSRVPPDLDEIVMRALAPAREDRFADCEAFRVALAGFLARESPAIDASRVASFLEQLFEDDIAEERQQREALVVQAQQRKRPTDLRAFGRVPGATPTAPRGSAAAAAPTAAALEAASASAATATADPADGSTEEEDLVGKVLGGRYQVSRVIGQGGMGRIYEGEHTDLGKRVAIKLLHPAYLRTAAIVERFRREARMASRIGHPNIVDITDSGQTPRGAVFFVMEYLEGQDLSRLLVQEKQLPVERAVHIAIQLARALQAAHASGIVHRDLKPENVFLVNRPGQEDFVKVLDFGIACPIDVTGVREGRLTDPGMAMGTPEYMAPEQAAAGPIDGRADIYSVGAMLYEMLAGTPPHEGKSLIELFTKKNHQDPSRLNMVRTDISVDLAAVVARALARRPGERQQTMEELLRELERVRPDRRRRGDGIRAATAALTDSADSPITRRVRRIGASLNRSPRSWASLTWLRNAFASRRRLVLGIGSAMSVIILGLLAWALWPSTTQAAASLPPPAPPPAAAAPLADPAPPPVLATPPAPTIRERPPERRTSPTVRAPERRPTATRPPERRPPSTATTRRPAAATRVRPRAVVHSPRVTR